MAKNKNLLSEAQVRKFMKLANLTPLGLGERQNIQGGDELESKNQRGHGRGRQPVQEEGAGLAYRDDEWEEENAEDDMEHADDLEADAEEDLGDVEGDEDLGDEELDAELDAEDDMGVEEGPGRQVSVDDFLSALETALEDIMGDEVEVSQEDVDEEEVEEEDVEIEEPGGDEIEMEMGDEEELMEDQGADDREDEHLGAKDGKEADKEQSEKDRRKEMRGERRAKGKSGDPVPTQEAVNVDALVNQITARVAKRIVQEAFKKRK